MSKIYITPDECTAIAKKQFLIFVVVLITYLVMT